MFMLIAARPSAPAAAAFLVMPFAMTLQTITGHVHAPFDRIPLGRPDHNVHAYVVLPAEQPAGANAAADAAAGAGEAAAAAGGQQPSGWRLAAVGEPGELWLSGER
jgi:hypothetical protein